MLHLLKLLINQYSEHKICAKLKGTILYMTAIMKILKKVGNGSVEVELTVSDLVELTVLRLYHDKWRGLGGALRKR